MEWLTTLKETLHYIEANLTAELTLEQIAQRVYLSPFYLQKGFQLLTGYSLGEYIRCRRLYEAARALVNTEDKVIDIAIAMATKRRRALPRRLPAFTARRPWQSGKTGSVSDAFCRCKFPSPSQEGTNWTTKSRK